MNDVPNVWVKIKRDSPKVSECWVGFHLSGQYLFWSSPTHIAWPIIEEFVARLYPGWWVITGVSSRTCPFEEIVY